MAPHRENQQFQLLDSNPDLSPSFTNKNHNSSTTSDSKSTSSSSFLPSTFPLSPASLVAMVTILASLVVTGARACSDVPLLGDRGDVHFNLHHSDFVAIGYARAKTPDPNFEGSNVFTVDFNVFCIIKGDQVPENITIHHVGEVPGLCYNTDIQTNAKSIVYLNRSSSGNDWVMNFAPQEAAEEMLQEFGTEMCGVDLKYPIGRSATNFLEMCPELPEYDYDECLPWTPNDYDILPSGGNDPAPDAPESKPASVPDPNPNTSPDNANSDKSSPSTAGSSQDNNKDNKNNNNNNNNNSPASPPASAEDDNVSKGDNGNSGKEPEMIEPEVAKPQKDQDEKINKAGPSYGKVDGGNNSASASHAKGALVALCVTALMSLL